MASTRTRVNKVATVCIPVSDQDRLIEFYVEKLGFTVEAENPGFVQFRPTEAGAAFALGQQGHGDPIELWWYVDDADATHAALAAQGVEIVSPPADQPFGRTFAIKDPAGNTLNMLQLRQ